MSTTEDSFNVDCTVPWMETVTFTSWSAFHSYILKSSSGGCEFVYLGQRCEDWLLQSSLSRILMADEKFRLMSDSERRSRQQQHLDEFQIRSVAGAVRSRVNFRRITCGL